MCKNALFSNQMLTSDVLATVPFCDLAPLAYKASVDGAHQRAGVLPQRALVEKYLREVLGDDPSRGLTTSTAKVHFASLFSKASRLWLEGRPNRPEYLMRKVEWETAFRIRYLLPNSNEGNPSCVCGATPGRQDFVVHALTCNKVSGFTWASRHALLKVALKKVLRQYGFRPDEREPRFGGEGPDVCFMLGDRPVLVDVTVVCPLATSYVDSEAANPGSTLRTAEADKERTYGTFASVRGMQFAPLAFATCGTPGPKSLAFLRRCSSYTADPTGFMRHSLMALGVAIQIGNARLVNAATAGWWKFGVR